MIIRMVGHCTVVIEAEGRRIVTDPYFGTGNYFYRRVRPPAMTREELVDVDIVILSHHHWDHTDRRYMQMLSNSTAILVPGESQRLMRLLGKNGHSVVGMRAWESWQLDNTVVTAVPAVHEVVTLGFVIEAEGKAVYFSGDTFYDSFMHEIGSRFHPDVALMTVTDFRRPVTMGERDAVLAAEALGSAVIVPIHLGIKPRLPLLNIGETAEGFAGRVREAGLESEVIILQEGQSWEMQE